MKTALCCALLLLAAPALADGSIIGTVINGNGMHPVAGAVLIATSPHLQGERVVVTDEQGYYRLDQLPVGVYSVRVESAFQTHIVFDISVRLHRTVRVNVTVNDGCLVK